MIQSQRKTVLLIVFSIIIVLLIVVGIYSVKNKSNPNTPSHPTGLEKGSNSQGKYTGVGLENTEQLTSHLLTSQYQAVHEAIGTYITKYVGKNVVKASIVSNSVVLNNSGSINFSVQTSSPTTTFSVLLQFPSSEEIVFSIPAASYTQDLYPYNSAAGSSTTNSITGSASSSTAPL